MKTQAVLLLAALAAGCASAQPIEPVVVPQVVASTAPVDDEVRQACEGMATFAVGGVAYRDSGRSYEELVQAVVNSLLGQGAPENVARMAAGYAADAYRSDMDGQAAHDWAFADCVAKIVGAI